MQEDHKAEFKKEKKIRRLLKKSAWSVGLGIGLFLLKFIVVPLMGIGETEEGAVVYVAWLLVFYGASIVLSFVFARRFIFKVDLIMSWVVLPVLVAKLAMDLI